MPNAEAFEAAAPLVECALKTDVSTPDASSAERIHLLIVLPVTPEWGAMVDTNNCLMFVCLIDTVRST